MTAMMSAPITVPGMLPVPPARLGTADDRGSDRSKLIASAGARVARDTREERITPGKTCAGAAEDMHEHLDLIGADAAGFRRVGIAADRIDVPADLQMRQNDMSDHDDDQENDDRAGDNAEHIVVADPAVCVAETGDGAAACDEQRRTADDRQKAECDDIRSKLALCDQNADDHADERARRECRTGSRPGAVRRP